MTAVAEFDNLLAGPTPILALAPMQDITDLAFWRLMQRYGGADLYFTEYFRVYAGSRLDRTVLKSVTENPTGRPVVAQLIGNHIPDLIRTARELQQYPVAGIDLNLGCPAPVVYRKCAGGGLLREPERVDAILTALRESVTVRFTVKTRTGFESHDRFGALLEVFARHRLDLLTVHARTVSGMYREPVRYDLIAEAVQTAGCPVLANGNIHAAAHGVVVLQQTGACGLMIGRGAVRNPWLFGQIRARLRGEPEFVPTGRDVLGYVTALFEALRVPNGIERSHVTRAKKHMNFIGVGIEPTGDFLQRIRRVTAEREFFDTCREFMDHGDAMPLVPYNLGLKPTDVMGGCQR